MTAAGLVLGASPVRAADSTGLEGFRGPITTWLALAPVSCVVNSYFGPDYGRGNLWTSQHAAYWVGNVMDGDRDELGKLIYGPSHGSWNDFGSGAMPVVAVDDPHSHVAVYHIGPNDKDEYGAFAEEPDPPRSAPPMRADLSGVTLGGNVHLGDSLAEVTSALGLHTLTPTDVAPTCPGFGVVELCDWNVAGCACPRRMHYLGSHDLSGTIIFRNGRVVGLVWELKCFAAG
jgi:hypothetical protein